MDVINCVLSAWEREMRGWFCSHSWHKNSFQSVRNIYCKFWHFALSLCLSAEIKYSTWACVSMPPVVKDIHRGNCGAVFHSVLMVCNHHSLMLLFLFETVFEKKQKPLSWWEESCSNCSSSEDNFSSCQQGIWVLRSQWFPFLSRKLAERSAQHGAVTGSPYSHVSL